jgi:hypothetical protein
MAARHQCADRRRVAVDGCSVKRVALAFVGARKANRVPSGDKDADVTASRAPNAASGGTACAPSAAGKGTPSITAR